VETNETMRVFGFAGWSGSGKTTLIEQIILGCRPWASSFRW
jgi:Ni2+-binding GTPase involved in maturation of urease and hydrogenase